MKKPGIIFSLLSVYIVVAFTWWTFAHIKSSRENYEAKRIHIEDLCYRATLECHAAIEQKLATDTNQLKDFFYAGFPELDIVFNGEKPGIDQYVIRPKENTYLNLTKRYNRKVWMYAMEGIVMVLLLFWGIIWVYRSLLSRLQLNRMQNNFLLSITHELKTPLASIKLYLETLQKRELSKDQSVTIIGNSINDVNRLRDLVDNILIAVQLDSNKFELNKSQFNISEVVSFCIEKYAHPRNLKSRLKLHIEPNVSMLADSMAIETIVINLLSNAEKYSPAGGTITITLKKQMQKILFTVSDEGIGITDEDKKNLFSKFFRAGDEQTRKTKGTGLGLFIVKNLLNLLNGEVTVKDNQPKGTIFEVTFNI